MSELSNLLYSCGCLLIHLILPPEVCDTISASSSRSDRFPRSATQIPPDSTACGPARNWASAAVLVPYAARIPKEMKPSKNRIFILSLRLLANKKKCPPHCTRLVSVCLSGYSFVFSWLSSSLERGDLFRRRFDVKVLGSVIRPIADDTAFPAPVDDGQVRCLDLAGDFLHGEHSFVP